MSIKDRYDVQLSAIVNALSHSIRSATDEEVLEDARQMGIDVKSDAERLRQMFSATSKTYQKRNLLKAREDYARESNSVGKTTFLMPSSPAEKRQLLQLLAAQYAQAAGATLTAKFRDLEALSDADVASILADCAELGLLPKNPQE